MVSVIVPNYNHEAYLELRIESVLNQTYSNTEIIILDDCSTDKSREIIEMYRGHPKVSHILYNDTNSGSTFKQWKKGIELAKGELIWIAESDDYADVFFLEKIIVAFMKKEETGLVFSNSFAIDDNGKTITTIGEPTILPRHNHIQYSRSFYLKGKEMISQMLPINTIPNASAVVFRKELIDETFFKHNLKVCGDWFFWIKLMCKTNIGFISEPLNYFRFHSSNVRSKNKNASLNLKEYLFILNFALTILKLPVSKTSSLLDNLFFRYKSLGKTARIGVRAKLILYKTAIRLGWRRPLLLLKIIVN